MTYTSAQANKLLKKLNDEHAALLDKENRSKDFRAAMGEDVESVRPAYDYTDTQKKLAELEQRIRKVKHAINLYIHSANLPNVTVFEFFRYHFCQLIYLYDMAGCLFVQNQNRVVQEKYRKAQLFYT